MEKLRNKIITILTPLITAYYLLPVNTYAFGTNRITTGENFNTKLAALMAEFEFIINFVSGFMLLTSSLIFIYHLVGLARHSDNPMARNQTVSNLLVSGICLAITGSLEIFILMYYYVFN